ncbi:MAG: serine--tRNA ligase [Candidatus Moranbacteria bacterium]|nr:serine--tRNA ligase [Candidatus Moranbacteria bacterium]
MLDIQFIRSHKEDISKAITDKGLNLDVEKLLAKAEERVALIQEVEELKSLKNDINELIQKAKTPEERAEIIVKGKEIKVKLDEREPLFLAVKSEYDTLMAQVPNIPSEDTPIGKDESENVVLRQVGNKPEFEFPAKEHWELGEALGIIDVERAVKVSGSRSVYLKGDLVLLEFALMQFAFSVLTSEEKLAAIITENQLKVATTPFIPVLPPVLIRPEIMARMARHDPEEMYAIERDNLNLIGSAEHTLGAMYADEILEAAQLPIRLVGFSVAFRREAGSYGKDMKGFLRMHQFDKLEMESFTLPEQSRDEQDFMVAIQEHLMKALGIPYQVVAICTGDMGKPDIRQIDIEAWMPGQNRYRETNTSDLIGDFQARRLNTKIRRADGKTEFVHMNDATAFSQRPLIAILENYQQADGSVVVPEVLRPFVGKDVIKPKNS